MREDIQGLRAVAVILVLAFHLWPGAIPGGYIGVDIFFVISGYLMTGILMRSLTIAGTVSYFDFMARRVRRIFPAAAVVIIAVALASPLLPSTRWSFTATEVIASAAYVENWLLADRAVDYLGRDEAAGVLQHFWSLGVEVQFYLFWPLVLAGAFFLSRRRAKVESVVLIASVIVVAFFLPLSIWQTASNPPRAYFATEARIFEFAIGAIAAAAGRPILGRIATSVTALFGVAAVFSSAFLYRDILFPGVAAILPSAGAAALIVLSQRNWAGRVLSARPMVYLGDVSYSVYLWHWPLIVFWEALSPSSYGNLAKLLIGLSSIGLAVLSKKLVEDSFRSKESGAPRRTGMTQIAILSLLAFATASIPLFALVRSDGEPPLGPVATSEISPFHPGAAALAPMPAYIPTPVVAKRDHPIATKQHCHVPQDDPELRTCEFGDPRSETHILVIGDSHASVFSDAFKTVAERNGWRYTHLSKSQCPFTGLTVYYGERVPYQLCNDWNTRALAMIEEMKPDFVVPIQFWPYAVVGQETPEGHRAAMAEDLINRWERLRANGINVIVMRDVPSFKIDPPDCLASGRMDCDRPRSDAVRDPGSDPVLLAASRLNLQPIDLTDYICEPEMCRVIVGNVLAWRDRNHLTATFVNTLVPMLEQQLRDRMRGSSS
ncbi:O-acetyltransferase OatA [Rhizobiaceae bacterium]|nr:O-acetyltransferase OatA [Rhizobiaceae bacterium]